MKKRTSLATLAAVAAAALMLPSTPVAAQEGTTLHVVHGLEQFPDVTVCIDDEVAFEFSYGDHREVPDVQGPVDVSVWQGSNDSCSDESPSVLEVDGFVPEGPAQAVVATYVGIDDSTGDAIRIRGLQPFALDVACNEPGLGGLTALHATVAIPPVFPAIDGTILPDPLEFGRELFNELPATDYEVALYVDPEGEPDLGLGIEVAEGVNTVLVAVGDVDNSTEAVLDFAIPVGTCDDPDPNGEGNGGADDGVDGADGPDGAVPGGAPGAGQGPAAGERPLALTG